MSESSVLRTKPFLVVMIVMVLVVLLKAILSSLDLYENFANQGPDDIMRLLLVRDWLAGQGWYDVVQYRALPPDGTSLHWSRYIDFGIASIIVPLSWILPMQTAEVLAAAIWPTLVMVVNLFVIGFGTRRIFGVPAACFAVICTVLWPVTGDLHSGAGNLDQHNLQLLAMTLLAFAVVWPSRPVAAGIVGGLAAAFSLALGLETLVYVICIGVVVLLRAVLVATPLVRKLLVVFGLSFGLGGIVLWLGQAAPATRLNPICDQLGTPTLALVWIAVLASILPLVLGKRLSGPVVHLMATTLLTVLGIFAAWSLLSPCLGGPYANLPVEMQEFITSRITDAQPGLVYARSRPAAFVIFVLPVFVATLVGMMFCVINRGGGPRVESTALIGLLFLSLVGIAMIFVQMRTIIMAASVVPIIAGYVLARLLNGYLTHRDIGRGLLILGVGVTVMSPGLVAPVFKNIMTERVNGSVLTQSADCRTHEALIALNDAPPGLILNLFSFGPSILWATHHEVLSIDFHRSAEGMINGAVPFGLEEPEMEVYVKASGATYLLLCRGYNYDGAPARALASGGTVDWLRLVPISNDDQLLFEVLR